MFEEPDDIYSQQDLLAATIYLQEQGEMVMDFDKPGHPIVPIGGCIFDLKIKYWYATFLGTVAFIG